MLVTHLDSSEYILDSKGPPDLSADNRNHTDLLSDPFDSLTLGVMEYRLFSNLVDGALHLVINLIHPIFNSPLWLHWSAVLIALAFVTLHSHDHTSLEDQFFTIIEQFEHVGLDSCRV